MAGAAMGGGVTIAAAIFSMRVVSTRTPRGRRRRMLTTVWRACGHMVLGRRWSSQSTTRFGSGAGVTISVAVFSV
jgi:hypothetical protein